MDPLHLVPRLLTAAMQRKGWYSERELARHMGCSNSTVATWRTGEALPTADYAVKLAGYAGYPPERALIAIDMLRARGKSRAIYSRLLEQIGGLPPFPSLTKTAA